MRAAGFLVSLLLALLVTGCSKEPSSAQVAVPGHSDASKSSAAVRAARRAFAGAPPVIPHAPRGTACVSCHSAAGMAVEGFGFAPPNPHGEAQAGAMSRCVQCHVYQQETEPFAKSRFAGLARDASNSDRAHAAAPPTIPHPLQLRQNCLACHDGPAAREEVRCSHPERSRCTQCHVPQAGVAPFRR